MHSKYIFFYILLAIAIAGCSNTSSEESADTTASGKAVNSEAENMKDIPALENSRTPEESKVLTNFQNLLKTNKELLGDPGALDRGAKGYALVYVPALNDKNIFDHELHGAGMYTYFEKQSKNKLVETVLVTKEPRKVFDEYLANTKKNQPEVFKTMTFIHDADKSILKGLEIDEDHLTHGGVAMAFDTNGKKLFEEEDYKCQGEKLLRIHQHFYPKEIKLPKNNYELLAGKKAPKELNPYIGDFLGKNNLLVTFYPAPLSHSCSIQMATLGEFAVANMDSKDLKTIAVSIGSEETVEAWEMNQKIKGIDMKADPDGSFSNAFNSLFTDDYGVTYSARTVFLIDKTGMVRYINEDYDVGADLDVLESEIKKL